MADHEKKKVALSLDEMAIPPSLDYDCRSCRVLGLPTVADSGNEESDNQATHALVFMLRGKNDFNQCKIALTSAPILAYLQSDKDFILDTDANYEEFGTALSREIGGQEHVIAYWSKSP